MTASIKAPFIIADVGSNCFRYNAEENNLDCALAHIRIAAECGASAVKFQMFTHEELYGEPGDNRYAMPRSWLPKLKKECDEQCMEFMCTAFSADGVKAVDPHVNIHKVASAEMMHWGIVDAAFGTGKLVLVSTGGATSEEMQQFANRKKQKFGSQPPWGFLECVASYPAHIEDYSLMAMQRRCCGISDHTMNFSLAVAAVGAGASFFEHHFRLDEDGHQPPDWGHSFGPKYMTLYCEMIREAYSAIGTETKRPRKAEADFVRYTRRPIGNDTFRRKAP